MIMEQIKFTKTELRMLEVLSDGYPHTRLELFACCGDQLSDARSTVLVHIANIRKKIRPIGEDIDCCIKNRKIHFRHIRMLKNPNT